MRWTLLCTWTKLDAAFFSSVFATFESLPLLKGPQYYTYWSASGSHNAVVVTASILLPISAMEIDTQIFVRTLYTASPCVQLYKVTQFLPGSTSLLFT
uniref:Putative secreted protein n=1 Tax=Rhipicephalus microplus TaxID=6941 RepID=A0A6G5A0H5_RHIMP